MEEIIWFPNLTAPFADRGRRIVAAIIDIQDSRQRMPARVELESSYQDNLNLPVPSSALDAFRDNRVADFHFST
jgi:hypothetical protein